MPEKQLSLNPAPPEQKITLGDSIKSFAESLAALRDFVQVVSSFLDERQRRVLQEHPAGFIPLLLAFKKIAKNPRLSEEEAQKLEKEVGDGVTITPLQKGGVRIQIDDIDGQRTDDLVKALKGMKSSTSHQTLLYRSALISLISSAEWFLSQVIRQYLVLHADAAGSREKVLSLDDLRKIGSIEDATRYLIDARIDELMWGGFGDWFSYLGPRK